MVRSVEITIRERQLIRSGMHVLAGVSGGADSMALLHVLASLREVFPFRLTAVHVHHGLRGAEADRDAACVERVCKKLNVPCRVEHVTVRTGRGTSLEMAARDARLKAFARVAGEAGADVVAVAHHAGDQAETVLMRLLSGSGVEGLGGMDYASAPRPGLQVIRPLLDVSRSEIERYLRKKRIKWREDRSNRDPAMLRNRVRHTVLPLLEKEGFPGAVAALVRLAEIMREEQRALDRQTEVIFESVCPRGRINRSRFCTLSVAEQRRVLRRWLGDGRGIDFAVVDRLRKNFARDARGVETMPGGEVVAWRAGWLSRRASVAKSMAGIPPTPLKVPGVTVTADQQWKITITPATGFKRLRTALGQFPATAYIKRDAGPLELRSRRPGDRISPTGMTGSLSLKELLIDHKVPVAERVGVPVMACERDVVWVAGYRIHRDWAVPSARAASWKVVISRI